MKENSKLRQGAFLSAFCTELAMVIETGIPIADGLLMLIDDEEDKKAKVFLESLYAQMKDGGSFSDAVQTVGGFPAYSVKMFVIGEKTGRLDSVMRSLAAYFDRNLRIKQSIKSACIFPIFLFGLLLIVMWILLTMILPVFDEVFKQLGISQTSTAGSLMRIGTSLESFSVHILVGIAVILVLSLLTYNVASLRNSFKAMFTGLFKNSKLMGSLLTARFSASMAMTLKSGLDIDESLSLAQLFAPNKQSAEKISLCRKAVSQGQTFNNAVLHAQILSPLYCRMLALSFRTGSTDEIMELIAEKSEEDVSVNIDKLIGRIEPTMALIMSLLIGLVLLSVMFPLLAVMGA